MSIPCPKRRNLDARHPSADKQLLLKLSAWADCMSETMSVCDVESNTAALQIQACSILLRFKPRVELIHCNSSFLPTKYAPSMIPMADILIVLRPGEPTSNKTAAGDSTQQVARSSASQDEGLVRRLMTMLVVWRAQCAEKTIISMLARSRDNLWTSSVHLCREKVGVP